jgi:hypothetical protein
MLLHAALVDRELLADSKYLILLALPTGLEPVFPP